MYSQQFYPSLFEHIRGAHIDVRNKKGNTPLWLAANGGHFDVVQLLVQAGADVDAADNRKITPLMAAFRKVNSCLLLNYSPECCLLCKIGKWTVRNIHLFRTAAWFPFNVSI